MARSEVEEAMLLEGEEVEESEDCVGILRLATAMAAVDC